MNSTSLVKVYSLTFSGKRVVFIYGRVSKRLPSVCPIALFAQVIHDPITLETQFICFDHRYNTELYTEFRQLENKYYDDVAYRKLCNLSHRHFLDYIHSFHLVEADPTDLIASYNQGIENNLLFG